MTHPTIQRLDARDFARVVDLQSAVAAALPAGFLRPRAGPELLRYLDGSAGVAFGAAAANDLQAFALLRLPSAAQPNDGETFPRVPAPDWPCHAAFLANAVVAPAARGRGLHRHLLEVRVERARRAGMRWLCAGVALANGTSWRNLLAQGMRICGIRFDLGAPLIGMVLPLQSAAQLACTGRDEVHVAADDADGHRAACAGGYLGVRCAEDGRVVYQRVI